MYLVSKVSATETCSRKVTARVGRAAIGSRKEAKEYSSLCNQKEQLVIDLNASLAEQDRLYKYMSSVEDEYQRAKEGAQQAANLSKRIQDVDGKIRVITEDAANYAENLKAFVDNIEINVFLPKLASNLSQEINNILRVKEQLQKQSTGTYPIETLRDVTSKIIDYLKELSLCSQAVDEENVISHIVAMQNTTNAKDPYDYLNTAEVDALRELPKKAMATNSFRLTAKDRTWKYSWPIWIILEPRSAHLNRHKQEATVY